jgi:hypothetical protein
MHSGTFPVAEYAQTLAPWRRIHKKSSFGNHEHCSDEKTLCNQGKTPAVWYSHQCTLASHHSRCTSTANKIAFPVLCKSIHTHFHHFTPSCPPLPEKPPSPWRTRGKSHSRRTASRVIFSSHPFLLIFIATSRFIFL